MKFEIKNRWSGAVIFECEIDTESESYGVRLGLAVRKAIESDADLSDANLSAANLSDADLRRANLRRANLRRADLRRADLRRADLSAADLRRADLSAANLSAANLSDADLTPVRDDIWAVLSSAPKEVEGLRLALIEGRVNGSTYTGECACLVGTIANIRHVSHDDLGALQPDSSRPAERFFMAIRKGDTPENNQASMLAVRWIDEWLFNVKSAFGATNG